jgi:hypothetical protein
VEWEPLVTIVPDKSEALQMNTPVPLNPDVKVKCTAFQVCTWDFPALKT